MSVGQRSRLSGHGHSYIATGAEPFDDVTPVRRGIHHPRHRGSFVPEVRVLGKYHHGGGNRIATLARDDTGQRPEAVRQSDSQLGAWRKLGGLVGNVAATIQHTLHVPARPAFSAKQHRSKQAVRARTTRRLSPGSPALTGAGALHRPDSQGEQRAVRRRVEDHLARDIHPGPQSENHAIHIRADRDWRPRELLTPSSILVRAQGVVTGWYESNLEGPVPHRRETAGGALHHDRRCRLLQLDLDAPGRGLRSSRRRHRELSPGAIVRGRCQSARCSSPARRRSLPASAAERAAG